MFAQLLFPPSLLSFPFSKPTNRPVSAYLMDKFKEKINQLKAEVDGANARHEVSQKKLDAVNAELASKGMLFMNW